MSAASAVFTVASVPTGPVTTILPRSAKGGTPYDEQFQGQDREEAINAYFTEMAAADGHIVEGVREEWRMERVDGLWKVGWLPRR